MAIKTGELPNWNAALENRNAIVTVPLQPEPICYGIRIVLEKADFNKYSIRWDVKV